MKAMHKMRNLPPPPATAPMEINRVTRECESEFRQKFEYGRNSGSNTDCEETWEKINGLLKKYQKAVEDERPIFIVRSETSLITVDALRGMEVFENEQMKANRVRTFYFVFILPCFFIRTPLFFRLPVTKVYH
jgi:hypothetical protein